MLGHYTAPCSNCSAQAHLSAISKPLVCWLELLSMAGSSEAWEADTGSRLLYRTYSQAIQSA